MTTDSQKSPDAYQMALIVDNIVKVITHAADVSESNATRLVGALDEHAKALVRSTEASDKVAIRLVWATWALVAVTVLLVIVGFLQVQILLK